MEPDDLDAQLRAMNARLNELNARSDRLHIQFVKHMKALDRLQAAIRQHRAALAKTKRPKRR